MPHLRLHDGSRHPVTAAWHAQHVAPRPDLASSDPAALEAEKRRIMTLWDSRARHDEPWPKGSTDVNPIVHHDERARVDAIDAIQALHKKVRHLGGRHPSEFGCEGVDHVQIIAHTLDGEGGCGCVLAFVNAPDGTRHPLKIMRSCIAHSHLLHDLQAHQDAVLADNRAG